MFDRSKDYKKFLQTVKIEIGKELGLNEDKEAYITLKELPTMKMIELKKLLDAEEEQLLAFFMGIFPGIIYDHNLYESENIKMSNEAITEMVFDNFQLSMKIIENYFNASFFTRQNKAGEK